MPQPSQSPESHEAEHLVAPDAISALVVTHRGDAYVSPVEHDSDGFAVFGEDWEALMLNEHLCIVVDMDAINGGSPVNTHATEFLHFLGFGEFMHGGDVLGDAAFIGTGGTNPWYSDVPNETVAFYDRCISTPMVRERHPKR